MERYSRRCASTETTGGSARAVIAAEFIVRTRGRKERIQIAFLLLHSCARTGFELEWRDKCIQ